ncbi:LysR family transcriptional regulator [Nonomuraea sp. NBC_01738]|uniref:LysR family transcriptional regulator n=1 Tax=Nonomuraea sp. NBC_01738 TaxID=2976003 RepID=UPI002E15089E|nr:LysR family transcriptional regulator [Nonomuraea sp. NBC_01738]
MTREIQCFAGVAARLSFSRAATDLGMSQPAVSQAITRLEKALGLRLFERNAREVRLTTAGAGLLEQAERVLEASRAFTAEAARLARPTIRLAYPPLAGPLAAKVARKLAARTPAMAVELHPAGRGAAAEALDSGRASAAIMAIPAPNRFVTGARFHVTIDRLAVPADHAWRGGVTATDLGGHDVLIPGGRWSGLPGRHRPVADDDFAGALDLVAAGSGLLPIPQLVARTVRRDDVRFVPLEAADLRLTYGLAWPRERVTAELMEFVRAVQEALWTR